jgi:phosphoribosylformylglycinamidine cyclo-ligase
LGVELNTSSWEVPAVFQALAAWGSIPESELFSVFNMGIGFCLVVPPSRIEEVATTTGGAVIGRVLAGSGVSFTT